MFARAVSKDVSHDARKNAGHEAIYRCQFASVNRNLRNSWGRRTPHASKCAWFAKSIVNTRQFAQICGGDRLRAAPHEEEQRLAAPAAGRMAHDIARALR